MRFFISILFIAMSVQAHAQYYYKDIILPAQTRKQIQQARDQKIRLITVASFEGNGEPIENFSVEQSYNPAYTELVTTTQSSVDNASRLTTLFDKEGRILKTMDTTDGFSSSTLYQYNSEGLLASMLNTAISAGQSRETEEHIWQYNAQKVPTQMLKIKNGHDTTVYKFISDEQGNIVEEIGTRNGNPQPAIFYYYDDNNRLTDIVRYNQKAKRLMPDNMFEYDEEGRLSSMMVIPEGTGDYQRWVYQYDDAGLKLRETVLNKRKQVIGKLEYRYKR